jgi:hypothetical protein
MKKNTTLAVSLGLLVMGLLLVATAAKADFFLWLDAPAKKSPYHIAALTETAIAKSGALPTSTDTRTITPTETITPGSGAGTATSTQTPGSGSTATSTVTPNTVSSAGVIYNASSAATPTTFTMASSNPVPACWGAGFTFPTTGGPSGGTYAELTFSCTSANFVGGYMGFGYSAPAVPITFNATGTTTLDFTFRSPAVTPPQNCLTNTACNYVEPNIVLYAYVGGVQVQSLPVSATAFLTTADWPGQGTWVTAEIPLTAFVDGTVFTTTDLAAVQGVAVQPAFGTYAQYTGAISGVLDMANIEFSNTTPMTAPTLSGTMYPKLVTDCEHPDGSTTWNTYWFWWADICGSTGSSCVAVGQPGPYDCPAYAGTATQITYPVYTAGNPTSSILPFQANTGANTVDSSCVAAHEAGHQGSGGGTCNNQYSSCGFGFNLYPSTATNQYINLAPSGLNFTGVKFKAKYGSTATGTMYIVLPKASITDSSDFRYIIGSTTANSINGALDPAINTSWQQYKLPFTAFGCPTVEGNAGWTGNQCDGVASAEYMTNALCTDVQAIKFQPVNQDEDFDLWIDDVEFY